MAMNNLPFVPDGLLKLGDVVFLREPGGSLSQCVFVQIYETGFSQQWYLLQKRANFVEALRPDETEAVNRVERDGCLVWATFGRAGVDALGGRDR
jgi:hypothetical protein